MPFKYGATDKGMVELVETRCGANFDEIRARHMVSKTDKFIRFPFSSRRKRMSTIICNATGKGGYDKRCLTKGAAEKVFEGCTHYINERGERLEIDDRVKLEVNSMIVGYAEKALRTIALAYTDLEPGMYGEKHNEPETGDFKDVETRGMTLIAILGIYDIIRSEVPDAVRVCHQAGVLVRMITGDKLETARAIAVLCGIIDEDQKKDSAVCIDGPTFYAQMGGLICTVCKKECPNDCKCETEVRQERVKNMAAFR